FAKPCSLDFWGMIGYNSTSWSKNHLYLSILAACAYTDIRNIALERCLSQTRSRVYAFFSWFAERRGAPRSLAETTTGRVDRPDESHLPGRDEAHSDRLGRYRVDQRARVL